MAPRPKDSPIGNLRSVTLHTLHSYLTNFEPGLSWAEYLIYYSVISKP